MSLHKAILEQGTVPTTSVYLLALCASTDLSLYTRAKWQQLISPLSLHFLTQYLPSNIKWGVP